MADEVASLDLRISAITFKSTARLEFGFGDSANGDSATIDARIAGIKFVLDTADAATNIAAAFALGRSVLSASDALVQGDVAHRCHH